MDKTDLCIIKEFYNLNKDEEKKFPEIVKSILRCKKIGNKEYVLIYRRILKMSESGIFKIGKNSTLKFYLDKENVSIKRFSFPTGRNMGMAIKINGKFQIFEL